MVKLQQVDLHSLVGDRSRAKKPLGALFDVPHGFVIMGWVMMEQNQALDPCFPCHIGSHVDRAVAPALARLDARDVFLVNILGVMDQHVRAANELDDLGITAAPLLDVARVNKTFAIIMYAIKHDAVQRVRRTLAGLYDQLMGRSAVAGAGGLDFGPTAVCPEPNDLAAV